MDTSTSCPAALSAPPHRTRTTGRPPWKARALLGALRQLPHGQLQLTLPGGEVLQLGRTRADAAAAQLRVHDWQVFDEVLARGDIGFGEAYMAGRWDAPDLTGLLRFLLRHRDRLEGAVYGTWWGVLASRVRHWLNRNTRAGSHRNIQSHYDLGNDFYRLWLDPSMTYSSACFDGDRSQSLEQAQRAKYRRALASAGVRPGHRVLEIGCGWGGLARVAHEEFGARHTGITLSREQLAWARHQLRDAVAAGDVTLELRDYRDVRVEAAQRYDVIVSIEMFEAVGRAYWDGYMRTVAAALRPGGRACIQTITLRDDLFARYARGTDFIQRHVFPGGMLPSPSEFMACAQRAGLRVVGRSAFGADYAETLRRWRQRFEAQQDAVRALGFDQTFLRLWSFYLCYCEAGFDEGTIDVEQFTLAHAQA